MLHCGIREQALREAESTKGVVEEDLQLLTQQEATKRVVYEGIKEEAEEAARAVCSLSKVPKIDEKQDKEREKYEILELALNALEEEVMSVQREINELQEEEHKTSYQREEKKKAVQ